MMEVKGTLMRQIEHWINGQSVASSSRFEDINPATGEVIAQVALGTSQEVDRAVSAARAALAGPWGRMTSAERALILERVADLIDAHREAFLKAEIADTGKPIALASTIDIPRGAANFRLFATLARAQHEASFWQETPDGQGALHYVRREPVGVVGVICPWNLPLLLMTWKVAPALVSGNAVVVKPSEETPATATLLGQLFKQAGLPDGVYNVVHGMGAGGVGEALSKHEGVDAITFTGETATGGAIMAASSSHIKKLSFELGGKNPAIIFEEADLKRAVAGTLRSAFTNCGQVCLCSERVYVARALFEPFVAQLKAGAERLKRGDPWSEATTMGPLISASHRDKVRGYFELARVEGAEVITGGREAEVEGEFASGFFVEPTIWTGLEERARCVREEIFGPVCHVQPFDEEEEAIAMANDTPYGLCAAIWTQDISRAHRVAAQLRAGMVWVNTWYLRDLRTPFGGMKSSGLGREGGRHSLEFYSELKTVCVKL